MKIWFMGTGFFASECLKSIIKQRLSPELVITMPPRPSGRRGMSSSPTITETVASELHLNVYRSPNVNSDQVLLDRMEEDRPDCIFVVDFGQKVKEPFLSSPVAGCLNAHPSLLPGYRGAAPVQRAIMEGQEETGVTIFRLADEMDAGPVILQEIVKIGDDETSGELLFRLAYIGGVLLSRGVKSMIDGDIIPLPQDSLLATYAGKIEKREALLSWSLPARSIHCTVRALNPSPGAFFFLQDRRVKLWRTEIVKAPHGKEGSVSLDDRSFPVIKCSCDGVKLLEVQPEGKKRMSGSEWFVGSHLSEGDILS